MATGPRRYAQRPWARATQRLVPVRRAGRSTALRGLYPTSYGRDWTFALDFEIDMDDLYRDYILEHYRRPHNFGVIEDADARTRAPTRCAATGSRCSSASRDGVVDRVGFTGRGCAISQASASLLTDEIKGKPVDEVAAHPRRRPARPARHRHQPGPPQVRDAQPRDPPARALADLGGVATATAEAGAGMTPDRAPLQVSPPA